MQRTPGRWITPALLFLTFAVLATGCASPVRHLMDAGPYERWDRLSVPEEWQGVTGARGTFTAGKADLDKDGEVSHNEVFAYLRGTGPMPWEGGFAIGQINGSLAKYDWDGTTRFFSGKDAEEPFEDRETYRATWVQVQALAREYGLAGVISHGYSAETDADLEDGRSTLYALGGFYVWPDGALFEDDKLVLAAGAAVVDFEEADGRDSSFIPAIQILWTINPQTELFLLGPELRVYHTFADHWRVSLGAKYDSSNFRTDQRLVPGGDKAVATDRMIPVTLRATYQPSEYLDLSAGIGVILGRMITIDYGDRDEKDKVDAQAIFELAATLYF